MLKISNLSVEFPGKRVLDEVNISVKEGEIVGIVGESGSGKTITALSIMGLLAEDARIADGSIELNGRDLLTLNEKQLTQVRGNEVSMIFQEPMTSLNPTMRIGRQLEEALILHGEDELEKGNKKDRGLASRIAGKNELRERVLQALNEVQLKDSALLYDKYPHQLSGGMRQRVMIAMGIICRPDFILCDEPTTALDVTTEKEIIKLLKKLNSELKIGMIFITHDLKLLRGFADRVVVMHNGKVVEKGRTEDIFECPKEEYTKTLINSIPDRKRRKRDVR